MNLQQSSGGMFIVLSIVLAMVLTVLPLPDALGDLRPEWLTLTVIYWIVALPHRFGVGKAWLAGLFMDALLGTLLGLNALVLAVVAYLTLALYNRMRMFPRWQQALAVMLLVGWSLFLTLWLRNIVQATPRPWTYWMPALTSALIWPAVFHFLRFIQTSYRVN